MKKLMIAAMVASAAMFAKAATVDWVLDMEGQNGNMAYYIIDGSMTETLSALLDDGDVAGFNTAIASLSKSTGKLDNAGYAEGNLYNVTQADPQPLSVLVFADATMAPDSKYWYAEADAAGYAHSPDAGGEQFEMYRTDMSFTQSTIGAVPEPTSGLLLLLGVAGLALRRRRA